MQDTDGAAVEVVQAELLRCALSWDAQARILGNVRAGDAARALREAIADSSKRQRLVQLVHEAADALDDCGALHADDMAQRLRAEADGLS